MANPTRLSLRAFAVAAASALLVDRLGAGSLLTALAAGGTAVLVAWLGLRRLASSQHRSDASLTELRRRLQQQRDQLADTVHELRTPLSALRAAVEMLREGYATTPAEQAEFLDQAACAAQHLAFLTNDVLDLSALEAGQLSLHPRLLRVRDLCIDAHRVIAPLALNKGIRLAVDEPDDALVVMGDRNRILQVAFNLLSNAVKYSHPDSPVALRVVGGADRVMFEVHDQGIGVPPERRQRLFTRFGRGHAAGGPEVESTGLGLHLCHLLIEQMGGSIGYRPGPAELGSVFWFALPAVVASADPQPAAPGARAQGARPA